MLPDIINNTWRYSIDSAIQEGKYSREIIQEFKHWSLQLHIRKDKELIGNKQTNKIKLYGIRF